MNTSFSDEERRALYKVIESRRDVRSGFLSKAVEPEKLRRVLEAAHQAPSVGFLQPWNFIVVDLIEVKQQVKQEFLKSREEEQSSFEGDRKELYKDLKLEGILEAPLNICVTCDRKRNEKNQLGRSAHSEMDLFSTVCAVQNMWLAARAEGLGMGWVSIIKKESLEKIFKLPAAIEPVAYLCLGYVDEFYEKPELELKGWQGRLNLDELIKMNSW